MVKRIFLAIASLALLFISSASAQRKAVKTADYDSAEKKCVAAIDTEKWKTAETVCGNALTLAKRMPAEKKSEKMRAYENYGFSLFSQSKFRAALDNWERAFEIGESFLTENDPALAYAYLNLGRANQGLANVEKAVEHYKKSEQIYRAAYASATDTDLKNKHRESVKRTLILQRYVARYLNDDALFDEIQRKIAELDKREN